MERRLKGLKDRQAAHQPEPRFLSFQKEKRVYSESLESIIDAETIVFIEDSRDSTRATIFPVDVTSILCSICDDKRSKSSQKEPS